MSTPHLMYRWLLAVSSLPGQLSKARRREEKGRLYKTRGDACGLPQGLNTQIYLFAGPYVPFARHQPWLSEGHRQHQIQVVFGNSERCVHELCALCGVNAQRGILKRQALKTHGSVCASVTAGASRDVGLAGNPLWLGGKIHEMASFYAGIYNVYPCSLADDSCQDTDRRLLMGELVEVKSSMKEQQGSSEGRVLILEGFWGTLVPQVGGKILKRAAGDYASFENL